MHYARLLAYCYHAHYKLIKKKKMYTLITLVAITAFIILFLLMKQNTDNKKHIETILENTEIQIEHIKKEFLCTRNEQKLLYCLKKVLDSKYLIHCQTSLIELVEPVEFRYKSKAWTKRVDFVITDKMSKIIAVIELDDHTHKHSKRVRRDKYVNQALNGHHPLIRIQTTNVYEPELIADILEKKASIPNAFNAIDTTVNTLKKYA